MGSEIVKINQFHYHVVERLKGDQTKIREYLDMEERKTAKDNSTISSLYIWKNGGSIN